jgi:hypothetical protein
VLKPLGITNEGGKMKDKEKASDSEMVKEKRTDHEN